MKFWLITFFILFALTHFFLWIKNLFIPLPLSIFGGAFLAIISNHKLINSSINHQFSIKINPFIQNKNDE